MLYAVLKYSPTEPGKRVLITQGEDGYLDSYVCSSSCTSAASWYVVSNIGRVWSTAPVTRYRGFDVDFEKSTGDAILVWGIYDSSEFHDLAFMTMPATKASFSGLHYVDDTIMSGDRIFKWVTLRAKPTSSQEMILAGIGTSIAVRNDGLTMAWVWDGSNFTNQALVSNRTLNANTNSNVKEVVAVEYEISGGKGFVAASETPWSPAATSVTYRYWDGSAWSVKASVPSSASGNAWLRLKADPVADNLQLVILDSALDLKTSLWDGSSWSTTSVDTDVDTIGYRVANFAWNPTGSTGKLVWDTDSGGTTLSTRTCSPGCTGGTSTISTYASNGRWVSMTTNPTSGDTVNILGLRMNGNGDLGSLSWDGSSFSNYGDAALTAAGSVLVETFSLAFQL